MDLFGVLLEECLPAGRLGVDLIIDEVGILVFSLQEEHEFLAVFVFFCKFTVLFDLRVVGLRKRVLGGNAGAESIGLDL